MKIKSIFVLAVAVCCLACSKKDDAKPGIAILGKWEFEKGTVQIGEEGNYAEEFTEYGDGHMFFEFKERNVLVLWERNIASQGVTYQVSDDHQRISIYGHVNTEGIPGSLNVLKLTDNELVLQGYMENHSMMDEHGREWPTRVTLYLRK